jgi:hypothetical protein
MNDLGMTLKEAIMAYFKILSQYLPGGIEGTSG